MRNGVEVKSWSCNNKSNSFLSVECPGSPPPLVRCPGTGGARGTQWPAHGNPRELLEGISTQGEHFIKSLANGKFFNSFRNNMSTATKQVFNNIYRGVENSIFLSRSVPPTYKCQFLLGCFAHMIYYWPCYYMAFLNDIFINFKHLFSPFQIAKERAKSDSFMVWCIYWDLCILIITPSSSAVGLFTLKRVLCTAHGSTIKIKTTLHVFLLSDLQSCNPSQPSRAGRRIRWGKSKVWQFSFKFSSSKVESTFCTLSLKKKSRYKRVPN